MGTATPADIPARVAGRDEAVPRARGMSEQGTGGLGLTRGRNPDHELIEALSTSEMYQEYRRAYGEATGLPLTLRPMDGWRVAHEGDRYRNRFCGLMTLNSRSCAECLQMQERLCGEASKTSPSSSLVCPMGLNESAVAVRMGGRTIGYLQTGQVHFRKPSAGQVGRAMERLRQWDLKLDLEAAAREYAAGNIMPRAAYDGVVTLLRFFAEQLGSLANQILIRRQSCESPQISRARQFVAEHLSEAMTLEQVAAHAHMSLFYFCKMFRKSTGLTFTDYVARHRVERAKELLVNPNYRISEIAFEVGFQSLTHFNRSFKRVVGESPSEYRARIRSA